jgi:hypothetical protein
MSDQFRAPDFAGRNLEFRCDGEEVCIYATAEGLRRLVDLCNTLLKRSHVGHVHLDDYEILTRDSLRGTIAIWPVGTRGQQTESGAAGQGTDDGK